MCFRFANPRTRSLFFARPFKTAGKSKSRCFDGWCFGSRPDASSSVGFAFRENTRRENRASARARARASCSHWRPTAHQSKRAAGILSGAVRPPYRATHQIYDETGGGLLWTGFRRDIYPGKSAGLCSRTLAHNASQVECRPVEFPFAR